MTNIIIVICCILAGFVLGKFIEKKIGEKGGFYQDLTAYILQLKDNVIGRQLELTEFNQNFAAKSGCAFAEFIQNRKLKTRLNKTQKDNLMRFFDNLDCVSSQALIDHINYHSKILTDDAQKVMQCEVTRASVYSKLGMLLGAMLGILFV